MRVIIVAVGCGHCSLAASCVCMSVAAFFWVDGEAIIRISREFCIGLARALFQHCTRDVWPHSMTR